jgi:hypothetical protein
MKIFALQEHVRLREDVGDVPAGAVGRVVGWFARAERHPLVSFESGDLLEVDPEQLDHSPLLGA